MWYYFVTAIFCCIGGLISYVWYLQKEVTRLQIVQDEMVKHLIAHDEHLKIVDARFDPIQANARYGKVNNVARIAHIGRDT